MKLFWEIKLFIWQRIYLVKIDMFLSKNLNNAPPPGENQYDLGNGVDYLILNIFLIHIFSHLSKINFQYFQILIFNPRFKFELWLPCPLLFFINLRANNNQHYVTHQAFLIFISILVLLPDHYQFSCLS